MENLLDELTARPVYSLSALQRAYDCRCKRPVFFRNSHCLSCGTALGYDPHLGKIIALTPGPGPGIWQFAEPALAGSAGTLYRRCANLNTAASCNWLIETDSNGESSQTFCIACRLNRIIPDLTVPENAVLWGRIEDAKRRVVSALVALGLPVASRVTEDPQRGLAFAFLRSAANAPRILTGHENGLITLNVEEADDIKREQIRASMREPYRTLVGHFRHEVGHYYWDRLVAKSHWLDGFRRLFGDERSDYALALQGNYRFGPPPDWADHFVSAYASIHPWEDWAETWAHYLHMVDTLGTALSFGLQPETIALPFDPFGQDALYQSPHPDNDRFLSFLNSWLKLSAVMNELCRSMGQPDFYPFALPREAITKLHFVHLVVNEAGAQPRPD